MPQGRRGSDPEDPGFSFLQFGTAAPLVTGTGYAGPFGDLPAAIVFAIEADGQWACPRNGTLWQLRARVNPAPTGNFVSTGTIRVNGADTLLQLVFNAANGVDLADITTQVPVVFGDLISFRLVTVVGAGVSFNFMNTSLRLG